MLKLTPERVRLLKEVLQPIADTKGPDRRLAQGILFSLGWNERKET